ISSSGLTFMTAANDPSESFPHPEDSDANAPSAAHEATASPVEAAADADREPSLPLPPLPSPPQRQTGGEQLAAEIARLDRALVAVVLTLAFLLASVAVRNSDFWMHLATGRLIARGQYHFGVDPFSYTRAAYWANHSWLYDLILYGLASASGGPES